ncbi:Tautomerase [Penicillium odoratum]|uniref:Tautomerase n=1 Tax=Penicillium odoratum TaxID=1167516 RepID=UPI002547E37C|nr:Tautomerase [Penicillium odoratum]KAJ5764836.1 Tautomerase [Penicillium odoratum]
MVHSKHKKPSLPRLATNIPMESQSTPLLPLMRLSEDTNVRPKRERPVTLPSPLPGNDENITPAFYAPETKTVYSVKDVHSAKDVEDPVVKTKTAYYEDAFVTRGFHSSPQERIVQNSVVVAELKTNCKLRDGEGMLVADLIFRLAQIYKRPETCIMLTVQQDVGVFFGSTTELSYLLKVYALPSFIAPFTNLRNTHLIQSAMQDLLQIPMNQGVIIFQPVSEENLATNGLTARGGFTQLERNDQEESPSLFKTISRSMSRRLKANSGQSAPISLPSTAGTATISPSMQTEIRRSPVFMGDVVVSPAEPERGLRKHLSLRGMVRRHFMEMTSARDKDGRDKAKDVGKEGDAKGGEHKEKSLDSKDH